MLGDTPAKGEGVAGLTMVNPCTKQEPSRPTLPQAPSRYPRRRKEELVPLLKRDRAIILHIPAQALPPTEQKKSPPFADGLIDKTPLEAYTISSWKGYKSVSLKATNVLSMGGFCIYFSGRGNMQDAHAVSF